MMRLWHRWRALSLLGRHERWRVAMSCPGIERADLMTLHVIVNRTIPVRGEVYCRCARCHAARALLGWEALR